MLLHAAKHAAGVTFTSLPDAGKVNSRFRRLLAVANLARASPSIPE
jgi:hypothetical protein